MTDHATNDMDVTVKAGDAVQVTQPTENENDDVQLLKVPPPSTTAQEMLERNNPAIVATSKMLADNFDQSNQKAIKELKSPSPSTPSLNNSAHSIVSINPKEGIGDDLLQPQQHVAAIPALNENGNSGKKLSSIEMTLKAVEPIYNGQSKADEVIELSDDDENDNNINSSANKRQRLESSPIQILSPAPAAASHMGRNNYMPQWMKDNKAANSHENTPISPQPRQGPIVAAARSQMPGETQLTIPRQHEPSYLNLPEDFLPTWDALLPVQTTVKTEFKAFELSLLNVQEFTITGIPTRFDGPPSSVSGLRKKIKEMSKSHGKAVFDRDKEGSGGKWRIPLGAYRSFFSYLNSDPMISVVGIPEDQLKIASLGKARLERGFPSPRTLISKGVPRGLAKALAPFQRGGVDFIYEKEGRALIADEMGLGKTIQAIAGMTLFHEDWPVLVLTPSSARYHWENEFQNWLGIESPVNKDQDEELDLFEEDEDEERNDVLMEESSKTEKACMSLLENRQIHVLTTSKDIVIPNDSTRVVICSYGLAPAMVESGAIRPGQFRCAIVDESHMLKNMATKRTSTLVPILHATNRCVLLSGTPALARPSELYPQLKILSTELDTWWKDEDEFLDKYVRRSSPARRAELFAMLTGTVMIRRLKNDILKSLPSKVREKAVCGLSTDKLRQEFQQCMALLREGKGVMGKLAKQYSALNGTRSEPKIADQGGILSSGENRNRIEQARANLAEEFRQRYNEKMMTLNYTLATTSHQLDPLQVAALKRQQEAEYIRELDVWYKERIHEIESDQIRLQSPEVTRKSALNHMYTLTAKAKVPLIADMINKWLNDPTKGKLCVFAHHIFVLDEIVKLVGLSNTEGSDKKYIRIDGSTSPKLRQSQIKSFQTNPDFRIAVLGITAAGVAVTLTASSTVWFAELFWTPALMIQAEDRCHRIGQTSQVKCLYFVAAGTLDELLWKLLEKKFRDLGEFVEGKEKMKIVVHQTYQGENDLQSIFKIDASETSSESLDPERGEIISESAPLLDLEDDLERDIALLGKEELNMVLRDSEDDDNDLAAKPLSYEQRKDVAGSSQEEAIALLSDDEDEKMPAVPHQNTKQSQPEGSLQTPKGQPANSSLHQTSTRTFFSIFGSMPRCRHYNLVFDGPTYGVKLVLFKGRVIVGKKFDPTYAKPVVGDILVAVNGAIVPLIQDIRALSSRLKELKERSSVVLTFAEDNEFIEYFNIELEKAQQEIAAKRMEVAKKSSQSAGEVIELLDDD